jgi:hypothetical protein
MLNFLVETKNEYTTHLINILTPLIFEGIQSIYKDSAKVAESNDVLKIFQSFLKRIPKWNQSMIDEETNRIINSTHSYGWLNDLIKATLKANIVVLMYNPTAKNQTKVNPSFYQDIKTSDFIHRIYIECARELWNNPYLMYHNYPPIEIKRNQRDCMNIIKECIKEAIRKLLPVKHILQIYLGEDMDMNAKDDQFEKVMSDAEEKNLSKMIQKDLAADQDLNHISDVKPPHLNLNETKLPITYNPSSLINTPVNPAHKHDDKIATNSETKTIGSKILNIINDPEPQGQETAKHVNNPLMSATSDIPSIMSPNNDSIIKPTSSENNSDSDMMKSIKKFENTLNSKPVEINKVPETFDDKIKKILQKDLATDSDLETSLNYSQEDNDNKYQEIFSNSNISPKKDNNQVSNKNLKEKKKFFHNYLQL